MALEIQEDCIGLTLITTLINPSTLLPIDLTNVSSVIYIFLSSTEGATSFSVSGATYGDPINGQTIYTSDASEFDVSGTWKYQVKLIFIDGPVFYSRISKIKVKANI